MARWTGWKNARTARADPAGAVAGRQKRDRAGPELRARTRSAGDSGAQGPRRDLGLCPGRRLSRCGQEEAEGAWRDISSRPIGAEVKVFVDTAPVMEKPLAQKAGLGWQGKHTNLVSREFGSWLFLGSIFTTLELAADEAESDHCGNCQALPGHLPHRRVPRALQAGCAALHFLSHHREQGPHPARIPRADGQSHLWLRRLSGGVSLEQIRAGARGDETCMRGPN